MKRYVALLRGVNISGKNKIAMPQLKAVLEENGFQQVVTYLNSGNVAFSSEEEASVLAEKIKGIILEQFTWKIPVFVMEQETLSALLCEAPDWWGTDDKAVYDNLIFLLSDASAEEMSEKIGAPTEGLEKVQLCRRAIFWSFDRARYAKANWWKKTAGEGIGEHLTIRKANTLRKIAKM